MMAPRAVTLTKLPPLNTQMNYYTIEHIPHGRRKGYHITIHYDDHTETMTTIFPFKDAAVYHMDNNYKGLKQLK